MVAAQLTLPLQSTEPKAEEPKEKKGSRAGACRLEGERQEAVGKLLQRRFEARKQETGDKTNCPTENNVRKGLSWLDLTLSQLQAEREKAKPLAEFLESKKEELENFLQTGIDDDELSFLDLDRTQDALSVENAERGRASSSELRRLPKHLRQLTTNAKKRASKRRIAREAF